MKTFLIIGVLVLSITSAFAECSLITKLGKVPNTPWIGATLENDLIAPAINEDQKMLIQTAFITNTKICYEEVDEKMVYRLSVKR